MLVVKDIDTKPAGRYAFAAAKDAERYSDECRAVYDSRQRAAAETFRDVVVMAYSGKSIYVTYRKRFIAVKIDAPVLRNRHIRNEVDAICSERGYETVRSTQGITFRIPRVA